MTRKPDQLDMAIRREVLTIRRQVTDARLAVRRLGTATVPTTVPVTMRCDTSDR